MIPTIETERLILRAPNSEDFSVYRDFFADAQASIAYNGPLSGSDAWRMLATDIGHWTMRGYGRWAVTTKKTGEMVGGCGLWWPEAYPRSELTWWIIPSARRNGFAREASIAAISFGHATLGWPVVETHMNDENIAARQLVKSLGGVFMLREKFPDGIERDVFELMQR